MATRRTADPAHQQTEALLDQLERRVAQIYKQAADEMQDKVTAFFAAYKKQDAEKRRSLDAGEITLEQYRQWRLSQMARGSRFEALRDTLAERMTQANEVAAAYINDATPGVYTLNRNYAAYTIEQVGGNVGFTLFDESTVRRLVVDQPDLMPYYPEERAIQRGIDLAWGKRQITAQVTSGILRGQSIPDIAKDLQIEIPSMNHDSAVRAARTAVTGAQNGGRLASYKAASDMGIKVRKRWVATKDTRTRSSHARLDGETVDWDKPFSNGLMFPGDPSGPGGEVYNCRCTMRTVEKEGIEAEPRQLRVRDPQTGKNVLVNEMTYDEWERWKQAAQPPVYGNVSTIAEAKDALTKDVGFDAVEASFDKIDEKLAIAATNQLQKLEVKFGIVKKSSGTICSVADGRTEAYVRSRITNPASQNLSLCPGAFKNYATHVDMIKSQIKSRWSMPALAENYDVYDVTHEYGHMLQNIIIQGEMEAYGFDRLKAEMNPKAKTAKAMFKPYSKIRDGVAKKCFSEIVEIAKSKNPDFSLSESISNYGKSNCFEFFAEVFANSQLGAPNELGQAMNEWLAKKGLIK